VNIILLCLLFGLNSMKVFDMGILIIIILFNVKAMNFDMGMSNLPFCPCLETKLRPPLFRHSGSPSSSLLAAASAVNGDPRVAVPVPEAAASWPLLLQLTVTFGSPFQHPKQRPRDRRSRRRSQQRPFGRCFSSTRRPLWVVVVVRALATA